MKKFNCLFSNIYRWAAHAVIIQEKYILKITLRIKIKKTGSYNSSKKYIDLIEKASVYDIAINSPITFAPNISQTEQNKIYLKREDLQPVFSFKNRGT